MQTRRMYAILLAALRGCDAVPPGSRMIEAMVGRRLRPGDTGGPDLFHPTISQEPRKPLCITEFRPSAAEPTWKA